MAFLSALGDVVKGSGWTTVVQNAGITRPGVAQALITGHDVVRTKHVNQVTACCLDILVQEAFQKRNITDTSQQRDFISWQRYIEDQSSTFKYWSLVLEMVFHLLIFLRAIRRRNFKLYHISIERMLPWFF